MIIVGDCDILVGVDCDHLLFCIVLMMVGISRSVNAVINISE